MSQQKFTTDVKEPERAGGLTYIKIPFNAWEVFDCKGRIRITGRINDRPFRSNLMPKGNGNYILVIDKSLQKEFGINAGDSVDVVIDVDKESTTNIETGNLMVLKDSNIDVLTAIRTRRSIRKFNGKKIDDTTLNTILESGFCAPSAKNKRPWHFIVIRDKNTLNHLYNNNPNYQALLESDSCIMVCGDKVVQGMNDFLFEDCSASIQNMLLAIHSLGLGGVWCGFHVGTQHYKDIIKLLGLPPKIIPIAMIAIGYPAEQKGEYERFDKSKVHYEKW